MKFSIGYQLPDPADSIPAVIADYPGQVAEVYFAPPGESSGRTPLGHNDGWEIEEAWEAMNADLAEISRMNVGLVLLFNAACFGPDAMSAKLRHHVNHVVDRIKKVAPVKAVTTTSIFIARILKKDHPEISVRASINMRVGSTRAMEHLAECFDGYYMQREFNRSPEKIDEFYAWCKKHKKNLHILANSGCLAYCAYQQFHDNLVAHEAGVQPDPEMQVKYPAPCWEYLNDPDKWVQLLQNTWIRPEDIHHYARWFDTVKLATRMHSQPRKVLGAYTRERFRGNLLDLFEPGHGPLLKDRILDNSKFPDDWHSRITSCGYDCENCTYCKSVFEKICTSPTEALA